MNRVENFINDMKSRFSKELEHVFYNGYCYWFALILAERFKGEVWFNPKLVHFAAHIDNNLYDIYGKITPGISPTGEKDYSEHTWFEWGQFQINNHEMVESIVDSCIKKVRWKR